MTDTAPRFAAALADRYRIERELGQGGMATVYLAHDLKHDRPVAIKVLRPELAAVIGAERFLSEIKTTANLQHPHILPLFDSGIATLPGDDSRLLFYVMPFIDGESLRDRLNRDKQLSISDAVRIATEVAGALDYAHRRGIVHRDIKPENILLHDGRALVADFGIALAASKAGESRMTQTGMSLGTPAYMSPEQAMGEREIGPRSDIYALGAMTYEMLVGDPPFTGSTVQSIVAKVMTEKPTAPTRIRDTVPPNVEHAVLTALQKLPADRFATAKAFADALADSGRSGNYAPTVATSPPHVITSSRLQVLTSSRPGGLTPVLAVVAALSLALAAWALSRRPASGPQSTITFLLSFAPGVRVATPVSNPIAMSPDGDVIAFSGRSGNGPLQLFVRRMDELAERALPGSEGAEQPFFSPDGRWIGFFANHQLKKVALAGGSPAVLAELPGLVYGGSWVPDGRIVVSRGNTLAIVPAGGGTTNLLSPGDTATDRLLINPKVLPDGKTVIVTRWRGSTVTATLWVATIGEGVATELGIAGTHILGMLEDHLVYDTQAGVVMAAPFDLRNRKVLGPPVSVLDGIPVSPNGFAHAALSRSGSLVYQSGALLRQMVVTDLKGAPVSTLQVQRQYMGPRYSPDGSRIAVGLVNQGTVDVWVYDLRSQTLGRITSEGSVNDRPEWTPDGKRVVFRSNRGGTMALWSQPVDGSGKAELLWQEPNAEIWEGVPAADGAGVIYRTGTVGTADIWYRRFTGDTARHPLAATPFTEWSGRPSYDGRWLAYESNESGDFQVYVRALAGEGARQQVSIDGGVEPVWSRDGSRLYYRHDDEVVVATLTTKPELGIVKREIFFRGDYPNTTGHANFDVAPDEKRLLMLRSVNDSVRTVVVHGWGNELRARLAGTAQ